MYNREFILEHQLYFPKLIRFQDPPFFVRAMITAERFYAVKKVVYRYRYGHRELKWTKEKRIDLLKGIYMDMELAVQNHLDRLIDLTWFRMMEEFGKVIYRGIMQSEEETEIWVGQVYNCLEREDRICKGIPFWSEMKSEIEWKEEKIRKIKSSETFRVGKAIVWLPRKIISIIKR